MVKIALMGHGVVGSGVAEVFYKNKESLERKTGKELDIGYILDLRDFPGLPYSDKFVKDFSPIEDDPEVQVVVEVMGGLHPAYEYTRRCLEKGKSVVTSNKELVATKGAELLKLAREHNVNYLFEASVGGGIPIIHPLHLCLAANEITRIAGILNGTTNYILTKMIREKLPFDVALRQAQELGYAERNPEADIEGKDACRKICILASLAFGRHVYPDLVHTEGITKVTLQDVEYAANWGGVIKLIGDACKQPDGKVSIQVAPAFLSRESQLAGVDDVFNGILVHGDATGDVVFYGKGAGKLPTASAVVADVIDAVKADGNSKSLFWKDGDESVVEDYFKTCAAFYLRFQSAEPDKAKELAASVLGQVQYLERRDCPAEEFALVTQEMPTGVLAERLSALSEKGVQLLSKIRVLDC